VRQLRRADNESPKAARYLSHLSNAAEPGDACPNMMRNTLRLVAPLSLAVTTVLVTSCKKEEPPPPLPSAAPVAAAPAPLQLKPEDAGVKLPADAGAKKKVAHGGGGGGGLGPCCAALQQNAASAPPPTNGYMLQAAAACQAMNAQGMGRAAVGQLMGMLRGAGMPPACK